MRLLGATEVATGLGFPEGPLVLPDGRLAFVEETEGRVSVFEDGRVVPLAQTGGNPNGLALGPDGLVYATRGRGIVGPWRSLQEVAPAIVAIDPSDGRWEIVTTTADGRALRAPNDLCFGPDGALYFTDPDDFLPGADVHGWIVRHDAGDTAVLHELGNTFPNGIAFDPAGRLVWTESHTKRVIRGGSVGGLQTLVQLAGDTTPDGCCYTADGDLVVATLDSGGLDIVSWASDDATAERIVWADGALPTNCCFDGSSIWVTDVRTDWGRDRNAGKLWRLETSVSGLLA